MELRPVPEMQITMLWLRKFFRFSCPQWSRRELARRYIGQVKFNDALIKDLLLCARNGEWVLNHPLSKIAPKEMFRRYPKSTPEEIQAQWMCIMQGEYGPQIKEVIEASSEGLQLPQ
jgi:hypothetical protein